MDEVDHRHNEDERAHRHDRADCGMLPQQHPDVSETERAAEIARLRAEIAEPKPHRSLRTLTPCTNLREPSLITLGPARRFALAPPAQC